MQIAERKVWTTSTHLIYQNVVETRIVTIAKEKLIGHTLFEGVYVSVIFLIVCELCF